MSRLAREWVVKTALALFSSSSSSFAPLFPLTAQDKDLVRMSSAWFGTL